MRKTLQQLTAECVKSNRNTSGGPDPLHFPSQVLCLTQSITFTAQCEEAIQKGSLNSFLKSIKVCKFAVPVLSIFSATAFLH